MTARICVKLTHFLCKFVFLKEPFWVEGKEHPLPSIAFEGSDAWSGKRHLLPKKSQQQKTSFMPTLQRSFLCGFMNFFLSLTNS